MNRIGIQHRTVLFIGDFLCNAVKPLLRQNTDGSKPSGIWIEYTPVMTMCMSDGRRMLCHRGYLRKNIVEWTRGKGG